MIGAAKEVDVDRAEVPRLRYADAGGYRRELLLSPDRPRITVGRAPRTDLALTSDPEVSQLHATVEWTGSHWTLVDDGLSRNGTFVNGDRITGRHRLRSGDRIRMGGTALTFLGDADDRATRASAGMPTRQSLTRVQLDVLAALCRPYKHETAFTRPASNQEIAEQIRLSVSAVKQNLGALFALFDIEEGLPPNQKRVRLAERVLHGGIVVPRDL